MSSSVLAEMAELAEHKRKLTHAQKKLASALQIELAKRDPQSELSRLPKLESRLELDEADRTLVDIDARVTAGLERRLRALGASIVSSKAEHGRLRARVPVSALERLAQHPDVQRVRPALDPLTRKDDTSEGDAAHRADVIRSEQGLDGSGITIGVVSDGIQSMLGVVASGDLPGAPQVIPGQAGAGSEGTAMLEIVYDLAPGATLWFATAGESQFQMADNIRALAQAGCDIIVDDVFFLDEATFQDDVVAQAVAEVVANGVLYFSAAGNSGSLAKGTSGTYEGDYVAAATQPGPIDTYPMNDWLDVHEFDDGSNYDSLTEDPPVLVSLEWADALGASANDYDLFLLSPDRQNIVGAGVDPQDGTGLAFEYVLSEYANDRNGALVIARWAGDPRYLRLATHRGALEQGTYGQISGHAAAPGAFSIAAVDADVVGGVFRGGVWNPVEDFSSDGPRRMFFEADGTPLTPGDFLSTGGVVRQVPDFAAADGVSVATPGFSPFFGTSAAAPHAAAIAALVLQARPDLLELTGVARSNAVRQLFVDSALDIERDGFDELSGHGLIMADAVVAGCSGGSEGSECDDGDPCTESSVCQGGSCVGTPIVCEPLDACQLPGTCNPETGACENPTAPDGTDCDDADPCSLTSSCSGGVCVATASVECPPEDACYEASSCDPASGMCAAQARKADDSGCDDDSDGVPNGDDRCPDAADPGQLDSDNDGQGDACDPDDDNDGLDDADELATGTDPLDANDPGSATGAGGTASGGASGAGGAGPAPSEGSLGGAPSDGGLGGHSGMDRAGPGSEVRDAGSRPADPGQGGAAGGEEPSKFGGAPSSDPADEPEPQSRPGDSLDAAAPDSAEAPPPAGDSGCACRVQRANSTGAFAALGLLLLALGRRSRRER